MESAGLLDINVHLAVACLVALLGLHLLTQSAQAATLNVSIEDARHHGVDDAVVALYAQRKTRARRGPTSRPHAVMDQRDKQFYPHVLPIQLGTIVSFPNSDQIHHQVYSFSPTKPFELPLYYGESAKPITFNKAGKVVLGCNIHDRMIGYIYVLATPYFAKTDAAGRTRLDNLPAGSYKIRIHHPRAQIGRATHAGAIVLTQDESRSYTRQIVLDSPPEEQRPLTPLEKRFHAIATD